MESNRCGTVLFEEEDWCSTFNSRTMWPSLSLSNVKSNLARVWQPGMQFVACYWPRSLAFLFSSIQTFSLHFSLTCPTKNGVQKWLHPKSPPDRRQLHPKANWPMSKNDWIATEAKKWMEDNKLGEEKATIEGGKCGFKLKQKSPAGPVSPSPCLGRGWSMSAPLSYSPTRFWGHSTRFTSPFLFNIYVFIIVGMSGIPLGDQEPICSSSTGAPGLDQAGRADGDEIEWCHANNRTVYEPLSGLVQGLWSNFGLRDDRDQLDLDYAVGQHGVGENLGLGSNEPQTFATF